MEDSKVAAASGYADAGNRFNAAAGLGAWSERNLPVARFSWICPHAQGSWRGVESWKLEIVSWRWKLILFSRLRPSFRRRRTRPKCFLDEHVDAAQRLGDAGHRRREYRRITKRPGVHEQPVLARG